MTMDKIRQPRFFAIRRAARVSAVSPDWLIQHRHIVLLRHFVDGRKEAYEILLCVDVLLPVGGKQNIPALLQPQPGVYVTGFDFRQVLVEHLGHGAAGDVHPLLGQAALVKVLPGVLAVGQVHVADDGKVGVFRAKDG